MPDGSANLVELAKYPVAVLSIFLALAGAKYFLGVRFDAITKISTDGVEFTQEAKGEITSLATQVNELAKTVDALRKGANASTLTSDTKASIAEAAQTVSDQTAELASVRPTQGESAPARGYIWIGDYEANAWSRIKLVSPKTNQSVDVPPSAMTSGSEYVASANLVLRAGMPLNDGDYFRSQPTLGVIKTGTRLKLLSVPKGVDREFAVQYWAQVEPVH
jgi:hypothetical protein